MRTPGKKGTDVIYVETHAQNDWTVKSVDMRHLRINYCQLYRGRATGIVTVKYIVTYIH